MSGDDDGAGAAGILPGDGHDGAPAATAAAAATTTTKRLPRHRLQRAAESATDAATAATEEIDGGRPEEASIGERQQREVVKWHNIF